MGLWAALHDITSGFLVKSQPGLAFLSRAARNEVESGYTEINAIYPTHLTEPQGQIKNFL